MSISTKGQNHFMKVAVEQISQTVKHHKFLHRLERWARAGDLTRPFKGYDESIQRDISGTE